MEENLEKFLFYQFKAFVPSGILFRCFDIFSPEEQKILKKYRNENFAPKKLVYSERRAIGKCPLTPEEVVLFLLFDLTIFYLFEPYILFLIIRNMNFTKDVHIGYTRFLMLFLSFRCHYILVSKNVCCL